MVNVARLVKATLHGSKNSIVALLLIVNIPMSATSKRLRALFNTYDPIAIYTTHSDVHT